MRTPALWVTRTAVFLALLIVMQALTVPLGYTLITGSIVNLLLIVSVQLCGFASGLTVAAISPIAAKLLGIGPLWPIIPFIIIANAVLVAVWHFICGCHAKVKSDRRGFLARGFTALLVASVAKFAVLYLSIVRLAVPLLLNLPEPQAAVVSAMFSFPQLFTAAIGGAIALAITPVVQKALRLGAA